MFCSADDINTDNSRNNNSAAEKTDENSANHFDVMNTFIDNMFSVTPQHEPVEEKQNPSDEDYSTINNGRLDFRAFSAATDFKEIFELDTDDYSEPNILECETKINAPENIKIYSENNKSDEIKKVKLFRKPDITALILCFLLILFSAYYIFQVYIFDEDKIKILYTQPYTVVEPENTTIEVTQSLMVNLNSADIEQLCLLNGIGKVKAQAIIDYRNKNGNFSAVEELLNVTGIGEFTFEKIREYICVN